MVMCRSLSSSSSSCPSCCSSSSSDACSCTSLACSSRCEDGLSCRHGIKPPLTHSLTHPCSDASSCGLFLGLLLGSNCLTRRIPQVRIRPLLVGGIPSVYGDVNCGDAEGLVIFISHSALTSARPKQVTNFAQLS